MLPVSRHWPPDPSEKWRVIGEAMKNTGQTIRLCLILLAIGLPVAVVLVAAGVLTGRL